MTAYDLGLQVLTVATDALMSFSAGLGLVAGVVDGVLSIPVRILTLR